MIITQTPLRISFAGGGTDFEDYYRVDGGCVVSSAIDKYIYVVIKERFDDKIRVGYSRTELVDHVDEVQHELVRECLRKTGIVRGVEITTMADIPSEGSGLGSSSSVTVGLLNAMYTYQGEPRSPEHLAREACEIEIGALGKPIGKQDQYIAAFGNLRRIRFGPSGDVQVDTVGMDWEKKKRFSASLMLFYTGITRSSSDILHGQKQNIEARRCILDEIRQQALDVYKDLANDSIDGVGEIMHQGWMRKRSLAESITNGEIDRIYESALDSGALGGKIAGAGGGGFLLLYCPPERHLPVRSRMREAGLKELSFSLERDGSKVVLNARR